MRPLNTGWIKKQSREGTYPCFRSPSHNTVQYKRIRGGPPNTPIIDYTKLVSLLQPQY